MNEECMCSFDIIHNELDTSWCETHSHGQELS